MHYNIRMYPWYYAATSFLAWLPVFFLYFSSFLSLRDVLLLESIYYIAVVILEVPTGYFSDLVGRKKTLVLGAIFLCLACIFYFIGMNFFILVIGQILFALHMSFVSGTNTVFHFESLRALDMGEQYGDREAVVQKYGMLAGGTSALAGGAIAIIGLRWVYVVTFIVAMIALFVTLRFKEPKHDISEQKAMENIMNQLRSTVSFLRIRPLGWIFVFYMVIFAATHVPYEFYQPYLQILSDRQLLFGISVPVLSGIIYAGARYFGAFGAAYSMVWSRKLGLSNFLLLALLCINFVVFVMGITLSSVLIFIVLLRSLPWAAIKAPVNAIITPRIDAGQRATFHSMLSLACRLAFFLTLLLLSIVVPKDHLVDWQNLSRLLIICFIGGILLFVPLWLTAVKHFRTN